MWKTRGGRGKERKDRVKKQSKDREMWEERRKDRERRRNGKN